MSRFPQVHRCGLRCISPRWSAPPRAPTNPRVPPRQVARTDTLSISATGVDSLPFMAILQAGINKKWFEEEGLKVDLYSGGGGGNTLRVVTSGDADMAIAGNTSVILAAQQAEFEPQGDRALVPGQRLLLDQSAGTHHVDGATLGFSSAGSSTELLVKGLERELAPA